MTGREADTVYRNEYMTSHNDVVIALYEKPSLRVRRRIQKLSRERRGSWNVYNTTYGFHARLGSVWTRTAREDNDLTYRIPDADSPPPVLCNHPTTWILLTLDEGMSPRNRWTVGIGKHSLSTKYLNILQTIKEMYLYVKKKKWNKFVYHIITSKLHPSNLVKTNVLCYFKLLFYFSFRGTRTP